MPELEFGVEGLAETARENFVGEIVRADYPCECETCVKGDRALAQVPDAGPAGDRLHVEWEPLTTYEKNQHQWLVPRRTKKSAWGIWNQALVDAGLLEHIRSEADLLGLVTENESVNSEVGIGDQTVDVWVIRRVLSGEEVDNLRAARGESEGHKL